MGFLETLNKAKAYDAMEKQNTFDTGMQKGIYAGEFNTMKALLPYVNNVKQQYFDAGHKAGVDGLAGLLGKHMPVPNKYDNQIPIASIPKGVDPESLYNMRMNEAAYYENGGN